MPFRFYRRFRAGPFRMNLSKSGVSYSVGGRGAWFTAGHGHTRTSLSIPGTGVGWYEQHQTRRRPLPPGRALSHLIWNAVAILFIVLVFAWAASG